MDNIPTELTQPFLYLNSGNPDKLRGPYATKEAACIAIPNFISPVTGKNIREGKFVEIGISPNFVTHWWKGGFTDDHLVEYVKEINLEEYPTKSDVYARYETYTREQVDRALIGLTGDPTAVTEVFNSKLNANEKNAVNGIPTISDVALKTTINGVRNLNGPVKSTTLYTVDIKGTWNLDPNDVTSEDDTGSVLVDGDGRRWKRESQSPAYHPRDFGAKCDCVYSSTTKEYYGTNDLEAFNRTCAAAARDRKNVFIPANMLIHGSVKGWRGLNFVGTIVNTSIIYHSSNSLLFDSEHLDEPLNIFTVNSFIGFTIQAVGDAVTGANAEGIRMGNCYGSSFQDLFIRDYNAGHGIKLINSLTWTEGTLINNVNIRNCKKGLSFYVVGESLANNYVSFCNTRALHLNIVTKDNQIATYVGPKCHIYGSTLNIKCNFEDEFGGIYNGKNQWGLLVDDAELSHNHTEILVEGGKRNSVDQCGVIKLVNGGKMSGDGIHDHLRQYVGLSIDATSIYKRDMYSKNSVVGNFATTKRFKLYTFKPTTDVSNNEKLEVIVNGGTWLSNSVAKTTYSIATREGLRIYETTINGKKAGHQIKLYRNPDLSIDVVLETTIQFTSFGFIVNLLEPFVYSTLVVTSQNSYESYDVSGKVDVTPVPYVGGFEGYHLLTDADYTVPRGQRVTLQCPGLGSTNRLINMEAANADNAGNSGLIFNRNAATNVGKWFSNQPFIDKNGNPILQIPDDSVLAYESTGVVYRIVNIYGSSYTKTESEDRYRTIYNLITTSGTDTPTFKNQFFDVDTTLGAIERIVNAGVAANTVWRYRNSGVNPLTITPQPGVTIQGSGAPIVIAPGESLEVIAVSTIAWRLLR